MTTYLFITKPDHAPEQVDGSKEFRWSCSKSSRSGDTALVYVTAQGISHEWLIASDAEEDQQWGAACDVEFVANIDPPITIQELRTAIPAAVWKPPHLNFRGYKHIAIPDEVVPLIRGLRARKGEVPKGKGSGRTTATESAAGFGSHEDNQEAERCAIEFVSAWYRLRGWTVTSFEREKCGYDLRCRRKSETKCVEVKGVSGEIPGFILTAGELEQAKTNPAFVLCVVTAVKSSKPTMYSYSGADALKAYALEPIAFRARLR